MKTHLTKEQVQSLPKYDKVNLVNSITGYKSGNLIGTKDANGNTNLAIFNSVTHLGSDPAMITITLRPNTVDRHSYDNMLEQKFFTVNHINADIIAQAHQTAARYPKEVSEFEATGLTENYRDGFFAPFVSESLIGMGCKYLNSYEIKENGCIIVVAAIETFYFDDEFLDSDYFLNLHKAKTVAISGLDAYVNAQLLDRFAYAKPNQPAKSILE